MIEEKGDILTTVANFFRELFMKAEVAFDLTEEM
jgi:hypothetical protein